jgi:hypothetical protein
MVRPPRGHRAQGGRKIGGKINIEIKKFDFSELNKFQVTEPNRNRIRDCG